ncbi:Clathrin heavy chain 1 [Phytophthora citrophthora]|uniref:Clathrin heavy chain 1 n=1 Tax=Phytophthora citrophthora TaxID=4793 RepID=A0AAD9LPP9_9STRA|nr:Clathrin heavy chain 1 [Phytophthora citrophthora]
MESDKFLCICEQTHGSIVIVDLSEGNTMERRPIKADSAIMNPVSRVIAIRVENQLQVFNMDLRTKLKSHLMSESVVFWHWISDTTIALITASAVFHWNMNDDSPPILIFYRSANLNSTMQIVSYEASVDNQWMLLVGISQGKGKCTGNIQLYSMETKTSQILQGYAGTFAQIKPPGRTNSAQVLVFAGIKGEGYPLQLFIMEVGRGREASDGVFSLPPQLIPLDAELQNDFPVSMLVSPGDDIAYLMTKMGYLLVYDVHSGKLLYRARIVQDAPFATRLNSQSKGILGVTSRGQLLHFSIDKTRMLAYVLTALQDPQLALSLASRMALDGAEELYSSEFDRLITANNVQGAAHIASRSPQGFLRTPETIERFQQMPNQLDQAQPVLQYFSVLMEKGSLNKVESIELARALLQQNRNSLLQSRLLEDKLECSEELGDLTNQVDPMLAMFVYLRAGVLGKVINSFVQNISKKSTVQSPLSLIHLCDHYDCVEELTEYLYTNNLTKYIDVYVGKVSPEKTPAVVGKLLDLECNEDYIKKLLEQISQCPVGILYKELEKRNRLDLLQSWLEKRISRGNKETVTHNALARVYVTLNKNPQDFLTTNKFYDSKVVGEFCEQANPYLAFLVYRRGGAVYDDDLIRVATENGLFKDLARYLVERQDLDLWSKVLMKQDEEHEDPDRRALIDQVVHTAIPESTKHSEVSTTVHAFMNADLSAELVEQNSCVGMTRCFAFF